MWNRVLLLVLMIALVSIGGCAGSSGGGGSGSGRSLYGRWAADCVSTSYGDELYSVRVSITKGGSFEFIEKYFDLYDACDACDAWNARKYDYKSTGTFRVGGTVETSSGLTARELDWHITSVEDDSGQELLSDGGDFWVYNIYYITQDGELLLGADPGTDADHRATRLDFDGALERL